MPSRTLVALLALLTGLETALAQSTPPVTAQAEPRYTSLYTDFKARQVGDLVTILLAERTAAQRQSDWQNTADATAGGTGTVGGSLSGQFALDATFNKEAAQANQSSQSDLLSGTITAAIVEKDAAGNLRITGERRLSVNGETHTMRVSGVVRLADIKPNNTVVSYQLANAQIEYHREGGLKKGLFKPGKMARFGLLGLLVGAIVLGS
jgi:flagellar L-ring protein precursor FlgH